MTKFNRWCLPARQRNQKQLRCFRCLETNHIAKNCNSEIRVKSEKKIKRDLDRLNQFIMRKTCKNFPFATLDNLDFTKTIKTSRQGQSNKILREVNAVTLENEKLLNEKKHLEDVIDAIKEKSKEEKRAMMKNIEELTSENKDFRTKLQKSQSINKEGKRSIEEADFLRKELEKLNDYIHVLRVELYKVRKTEQEIESEWREIGIRYKDLEKRGFWNIDEPCKCKRKVEQLSPHNNHEQSKRHVDNNESREFNFNFSGHNSNRGHNRGKGRRGRK